MTLDVLTLTRKLLGFETINPPGDERACAHYLGSLLEAGGYETRYYEFADKRSSLIARLAGPDEKLPICFTGHLDTVPLGTTAWSRDPFIGESDGDKLYGRGTSDMKSGVAAIVSMALRLAQLANRQAGVTLIFTAGEETTCEGAHYLASLDNVIGKAGALIAGEPSANAPYIAHKGCLRYTATFTGTTAHASMPEQGDNAIHHAAAAISKLATFDFDVAAHPFLGKPTLAVTMVSAGTAINMIPATATISMDIRTLPGQTATMVHRQLVGAWGDVVAIKHLNGAASVGTDERDEWVQEVFGIVETLSGGKRPKAAGATYFTDCSVLTPAFGNPPTIILGPGEPEMAHKTDEFCYLSKVEFAVEAYTEIARRWCGV
jgi:succinyl-diaminopimelate desuccinylase